MLRSPRQLLNYTSGVKYGQTSLPAVWLLLVPQLTHEEMQLPSNYQSTSAVPRNFDYTLAGSDIIPIKTLLEFISRYVLSEASIDSRRLLHECETSASNLYSYSVEYLASFVASSQNSHWPRLRDSVLRRDKCCCTFSDHLSSAQIWKYSTLSSAPLCHLYMSAGKSLRGPCYTFEAMNCHQKCSATLSLRWALHDLPAFRLVAYTCTESITSKPQFLFLSATCTSTAEPSIADNMPSTLGLESIKLAVSTNSVSDNSLLQITTRELINLIARSERPK